MHIRALSDCRFVDAPFIMILPAGSDAEVPDAIALDFLRAGYAEEIVVVQAPPATPAPGADTKAAAAKPADLKADAAASAARA